MINELALTQNVHLSLYDSGVVKVLLRALPVEKEWEVLKIMIMVRRDIDIEYLDQQDGSCVIITLDDNSLNGQIEEFAVNNGYLFTTD